MDVKWILIGSHEDVQWISSNCQVDVEWMSSGCRVDVKWMSIGLMKLRNRGGASRVCRKRI